MNIIGGHHFEPELICQSFKLVIDLLLDFKTLIIELEVKIILPKDITKSFDLLARCLLIMGSQPLIERTVHTSTEADQTL